MLEVEKVRGVKQCYSTATPLVVEAALRVALEEELCVGVNEG
jgi:hypothetical protein